MDRIAMFGGTFNPIHNGHINLCKECQDLYKFDQVLLIPTNLPPHKNTVGLASNKDRYSMLMLAVEALEDFHVSDIEYQLGQKSYTIHTIVALKKKYPKAQLYLIMGSDMLGTFKEWYRYEEILEQVTLIVGARHEAEYAQLLKLKEQFGDWSDKIEVISLYVLEISSTAIRQSIAQGEDVRKSINPKVADYIMEHNLYQ